MTGKLLPLPWDGRVETDRIRALVLVTLGALLLTFAGTGAASASDFAPHHGRTGRVHAAKIRRVTPRNARRLPSTARPHARPHFAAITSKRDGQSRPAGASRRLTPTLATEQGTITFSEFPDGTDITNQYQPNGIVFGGDSPFITEDGSNPTSPVLSGTPLFFGTITGTFVQPNGAPRTVGDFSLDVGYIDTPGSTEVIAYDSSGNTIDTVPIDDTGIVSVSISVPGIASFTVQTVDPGNPDPNGWAIDNLAFQGYGFLTGPPTVTEQGAAPNESEHGTTCYVLEPVNCATGTLVSQSTDFSVAGRGMPLTLQRTYSSASAGTDGVFGFGWTGSYAMSLSTDGSDDVTINQEDGSAITFQPDGAGGLVAPDRILATLTKNADGSYTFTRDSSQDSFNFSGSGQLTSMVDRNGYTTELAYSNGLLTSVTDPAGRQLTFTYSGSHITKATDPLGRTWTYTYDASGNLVTATDPLGRTWTYTYDPGHLLLTVTDPRGGVTTSTYNATGQVVSQTDPDGGKTTWSYAGDPATAAGGTTTMTDANGNVTIYNYTSLELTSLTRGSGTPDAATTSYTYDPATLGVTSVTDPNGNVTTNTYDSSGNMLTTTDPLGNTISYTYNSFNEVLTKTSPLGETTTTTYDVHGNPLTVTDPLGGVTTYAYGDSVHPGDATSITDADGNIASYTYDSAGNIASASVSPAPGKIDTTAYAYDTDGERTCQASANATAAGVACPPAGSPRVADTTSTVYNADGEITSVTDANDRTTSYAYDGDGNKTQITDAIGHVTSFAYNGNNHQIKVTRPDGSTISSTYDGNSNLTSQVNAAGATTRYTYDSLDRVSSVINPLSKTTSYGYDADGNRTSLTDPSGRVTSYSYDQANELTGITYSDGSTPDVTYSYDPDGQRTGMSDGTGTTSYTYDSDGRLTAVTNGTDATVSYGYDAAGLLTSLTYPNGQTVTRSYDGARHLASVSDWLGNTTRFSYDADGNPTGEAYPNGVTAASSFDNSDQLTAITDKTATATLASFSYTRDAKGQVTSDAESGTVPGTRTFTYNQLGQLASNNGKAFGYDAADNLTMLGNGITQSFNAGDEVTSAQQSATVKAPSADQVVSADQTSKGKTIVSPGITTSAAGELLVALVSAAGPSTATQKITTVSGGGLNWTLVAREDAQQGTAEVWQTHAARPLTSVKITASLASTGHDGSITVASFTNAQQVAGAHAVASGDSTKPVVSLTTTAADSLVWGVGEDPTSATSHTPVSGQIMVHQKLDTGSHATYWMQKTGAITSAGTILKLSATTKATDHWNLAAVEITSASGTTTKFSYDANGNRTKTIPSSGSATAVTYDQANRLTSYGGVATYTYDGDGLRMSKTTGGTTAQFAWDQSGSLPLVLTDGSLFYIYGPDGQPIEQIQGSTPTYLQADQQGSTRLLTSSTGAVVGTYSYSPYGVPSGHTGTIATALQYDGQYTDYESGFQYLQARYYDPATGQFLSQDPLVSATGEPYQYAGESPVTFTDPSGLIPLSCDELGALSQAGHDLDTLLDSFHSLLDSLDQRASVLGYLLRYGSTPEVRSYAASLLREAGQLARRIGPVEAVGRFLPEVGAALGFSADLINGDSVGRAALKTGGSLGGGAAGAGVGGLVCGFETFATLGVGSLACPVLITGGAAAGAYVGQKIGGWAADLLHW